MNAFVALVFLCSGSILFSQQYPPGFLEYDTGFRDGLIDFDMKIIDTVTMTLSDGHCSDLIFFLKNFQNESVFTGYPSGFNFKKYPSGFSNVLKRKLVETLFQKKWCVNEVLMNLLAPGNCSADKLICVPVYEEICSNIDLYKSQLKEIISVDGYRLNLHDFGRPNLVHSAIVSEVKLFLKSLFTDEDFKKMSESQKIYILGM